MSNNHSDLTSGQAADNPAPDNNESKKMRLNVNLSEDVANALRALADSKGISLTEVLRQAISTEQFLSSEVKDGGKVLIKGSNGKLKELVFR